MSIKLIREVSKEELVRKIYDINLEDKNLYREVNNPDMLGVFQLTGKAAKPVLDIIKPKDFNEITAVNAFARPGTINFVPDYVTNRKENKSSYGEQISSLLEDTHRVFLYQEQVMAVFNKVGGFSLEETNQVRSTMKKLGKKEKDPKDIQKWEKMIERFTEGAKKLNVPEADIEKMKDDLAKLSEYSFCKAHAVAYSYIAAITLYFSFYFRKYFYASTLSYEVDREKYLIEKIRNIRNQGVEIYFPDINKSNKFSSPVENENAIRFGISEVKGVGPKATDLILQRRPFSSFDDFLYKNRKGVNSKTIISLIKSGAFDNLYLNRKVLIKSVEEYWIEKKSIKVEEKLKLIWNGIKIRNELLNLPYGDVDKIKYEKECFGHNYFTSLFNLKRVRKLVEELEKKSCRTDRFVPFKIKKRVSEITSDDFSNNYHLMLVTKIFEFVDKNGNKMAFVHFEDEVGESISVPFFSTIWFYLDGRNAFSEGDMVLVRLYKVRKDNKDNYMVGNGKGLYEPDALPENAKESDIKKYSEALESLRNRARGSLKRIRL